MDLARLLPRLAAGLVALGVVAGTALDRAPERPAAYRAGYRVLEGDFHAHTRFSDGFLSPFDVVLQAERRGLDVLAITEHNITFPAFLGRWFSRRIGGPAILVGEEVTSRRFHLITVGLTERVNASLPLPEVIAAVHRQGGVAIAAHPVGRFRPTFEAQLGAIDGAEVMHPLAYGEQAPGWHWPDMRDFYNEARASGHPLTAIGSSDYHAGSVLGLCRTLLFARDGSEEAAFEAVKAGRTVVYDLEGRAYGDPAMIEALAREPYTPRAPDYGYHGSGIADRLARAAGWLGLVALVLFGLRSRRLPTPSH